MANEFERMRRLAWLPFWLGCVWAATAGAAGFNLTDTQGRQHRLADYRDKWVLVNFWATWCPPCIEEIPEFSALYDERKDADLVVLGVALEFADPQAVIDFAASHSMSYPLVLGNERIVAQFGPVKALPASYLYDQKGKLVLRRVGPLSREEIEVIIGKPPKVPRPKSTQR